VSPRFFLSIGCPNKPHTLNYRLTHWHSPQTSDSRLIPPPACFPWMVCAVPCLLLMVVIPPTIALFFLAPTVFCELWRLSSFGTKYASTVAGPTRPSFSPYGVRVFKKPTNSLNHIFFLPHSRLPLVFSAMRHVWTCLLFDLLCVFRHRGTTSDFLFFQFFSIPCRDLPF